MKSQPTACLLLCFAAVVGCTTPQDLNLAHLVTRAELTKVVADTSKTLSDQHLAIGDDNLKALRAEVKNAHESANSAIIESGKALEKALQEEKNRVEALKGFLKIAELPTSPEIKEFLQPTIDKLDSKISALKDKVSETKLQVTSAEKEIEKARDLAEVQLGAMQEQLDGLDTDLAQSLSQTPPEVIRQLESLKGDDKSFREQLRSSLNLTAQQMKQLEGYTTEELLALIAAAVTAAGAGGMLGKTGKSRAQADIDKIKAEISGLSVSKTTQG